MVHDFEEQEETLEPFKQHYHFMLLVPMVSFFSMPVSLPGSTVLNCWCSCVLINVIYFILFFTSSCFFLWTKYFAVFPEFYIVEGFFFSIFMTSIVISEMSFKTN